MGEIMESTKQCYGCYEKYNGTACQKCGSTLHWDLTKGGGRDDSGIYGLSEAPVESLDTETEGLENTSSEAANIATGINAEMSGSLEGEEGGGADNALLYQLRGAKFDIDLFRRQASQVTGDSFVRQAVESMASGENKRGRSLKELTKKMGIFDSKKG
jgi:hypothetical protein